MKKILVFLAALIVLLMLLLGTNSLSAKAAGDCVLDVRGTIGVTICGGEVVDSVPLPKVTVTETVVKTVTDTVTKTVRVPGPTVTVPGPTVMVPGPTVTMGPPAPHSTVFQPGKTATVFVPRATVTVRPSETAGPGPFTAAPETRFAQPDITPRQGGTDRGTMDPSDPTPFTFDFGDGDLTTVEAALGLTTLLALVGLMLAGMYAGYYLGYKDKERKDTNFMRALLDAAKVRGKHS